MPKLIGFNLNCDCEDNFSSTNLRISVILISITIMSSVALTLARVSALGLAMQLRQIAPTLYISAYIRQYVHICGYAHRQKRAHGQR